MVPTQSTMVLGRLVSWLSDVSYITAGPDLDQVAHRGSGRPTRTKADNTVQRGVSHWRASLSHQRIRSGFQGSADALRSKSRQAFIIPQVAIREDPPHPLAIDSLPRFAYVQRLRPCRSHICRLRLPLRSSRFAPPFFRDCLTTADPFNFAEPRQSG